MFEILITIAAIIAAPIIAIQVSKFLDKRSEVRNRRKMLFYTLMAYRKSPLHFEFVRALNMIDLEFYGKSKMLKDVRNAWKALLSHFEEISRNTEESTLEIWYNKVNELQTDLLFKMALALDYDFDKTDIRRAAYSPVAHGEMEQDLNIIRQRLMKILSGEGTLPVSLDYSNDDKDKGEKLFDLLSKFLSGRTSVKVDLDRNMDVK